MPGDSHANVKLLLASASPARQQTFRNAGVDPWVLVSHLDEDVAWENAQKSGYHPQLLATEKNENDQNLPEAAIWQVTVISEAKAQAVAEKICHDFAKAAELNAEVSAQKSTVADANAQDLSAQMRKIGDFLCSGGTLLVLGCDSMLNMPDKTSPTGQKMVGKPHTAAKAKERWHEMMEQKAQLLTGHTLLKVEAANGKAQITGKISAICTTQVSFARLSEMEIDGYIASGEPLEVAGAFTLDSLGGWFVTGLVGDPHSVVGVSLALVRKLMTSWGFTPVDLWKSQPHSPQLGR